MTDEPLRANPEDRPVPPPGQRPAPASEAVEAAAADAGADATTNAAPGVAPDASVLAAPADLAAGSHTRPLRQAKPPAARQPLAWSGFLLGALALVFAIGLAALLWRFAGGERAAPLPEAALATGELLEMETLLEQLGFPPGALDGTIDADSLAAIRDFQTTAGLPVDGAPSAALLEELRAALAELSGGG